MGSLVITQDGEKLFAAAPDGERMELVPEQVADKFIAQPVGAPVTFARDGSGKVMSVLVVLPNGREVQGKKTQ